MNIDLGESRFFDATFARKGTVLVGTTISRTSQESSVTAYDCLTGLKLWSQPTPLQSWVRVSKDETWLASVDAKNVRLWDLPTGQQLRMFDRTFGVSTAIEGDRLLTLEKVPTQRADGSLVDAGSCLFVVNVRTGTVESFFGLGADISRVDADDEGQRIACLGTSRVSGRNELSVWDLATKTRTMSIAADLREPVVFRPHSNELIAPFEHHGPMLLDALSGRTLARLTDDLPEGGVAMALSADGKLLATSHGFRPDNHAPLEDHCVRVWDLERRALQRRIELDAYNGPSSTLYVGNDGRVMAACSDRELCVTQLR